MRWAPVIWMPIIVLLSVGQASAQFEIAPTRLAAMIRNFEPHPGDAPLRCEVTPLTPILNFAFRFEAGYTFHVPDVQYPTITRGWSVLTKITPEGDDRPSIFLMARNRAADVNKSDSNFDVRGLYFLGVGRYSVDASIRDDRNRVCHKHWQVEVKPLHGAHAVESALPAGTVHPFSTYTAPDLHPPDDAAPQRLSVLVNAAAFSPRRMVLNASDQKLLLDHLTALLERIPATSVRLVVFSLEQQQEFFRSETFSLPALEKVAQALNRLQLAAVDVHILQKPFGHLDFLTALVNQELHSPAPADTVVFLGPASRYGDKIPESVMERTAGPTPHFFYVQYQGPRRAPMPSQIADDPPLLASAPVGTDSPVTPPPPTIAGGAGRGGGGRGSRGLPFPALGEHNTDIISSAVARLKGKTLSVHSPAELAKAIRRIETSR